MSNKQEPLPYAECLWAIQGEDVQVTLILHDPDFVRSVYLVTRTTNFSRLGNRRQHPYMMPWDHALVLEFSDSPSFLINGEQQDVMNSDMEKWCALVDAIDMSPYFPEPGTCITTRYEEEE